MNQSITNDTAIRGQWNQLKGKAKEKFGQLTDDDWMKADGSKDQMIGMLQARYSYSRERAQSEWDRFVGETSKSLTNDVQTNQSTGTNASGMSNMAQSVKEVATNALDQGKQVVEETLDEATKRAGSMVTEQTQQAAQKLHGVAGALRSSSDELRKGEQETFADYASAAATYVDDFSNFLRNRHPMELWGDVQSFARRQPEVFVMGTLAAGFLLGRFLRSSDSPASKSTFADRATPPQYQRAKASRSSRQNAPDGEDIFIQGTTSDSYEDWKRYASEGGTKASETPVPATFATPTRPENRPEAAKRP